MTTDTGNAPQAGVQALTVAEDHARAVPKMTEKQLQSAVVNLARIFNWRVYHTFLSVRSAPGFPDLVLVRDGTLLFVELKGPNGRVSAAQREWLDALGEVQNQRVGVVVWTPEHWHNGIIEYVLRPARPGGE